MNIKIKNNSMGIGDWGLGIGDLGIGPNPQSPKNINTFIIYLLIKIKLLFF